MSTAKPPTLGAPFGFSEMGIFTVAPGFPELLPTVTRMSPTPPSATVALNRMGRPAIATGIKRRPICPYRRSYRLSCKHSAHPSLARRNLSINYKIRKPFCARSTRFYGHEPAPNWFKLWTTSLIAIAPELFESAAGQLAAGLAALHR
jgi:hypothetical protein